MEFNPPPLALIPWPRFGDVIRSQKGKVITRSRVAIALSRRNAWRCDARSGAAAAAMGSVADVPVVIRSISGSLAIARKAKATGEVNNFAQSDPLLVM